MVCINFHDKILLRILQILQYREGFFHEILVIHSCSEHTSRRVLAPIIIKPCPTLLDSLLCSINCPQTFFREMLPQGVLQKFFCHERF